MSEEDKNVPQKKGMENGVIFLGEDQGYWESLKHGFAHFKQLKFDFELRYEANPKKIQNFIKFIFNQKPKVVFVDLSKNTLEMLHVLRAQIRTNMAIKPFVIALVDYNQGKNVLQQAIMAGANCAHIKSGEVEAVVYDAIAFAFSNALEDHGFATAKLNDETSVFVPAKVSLVSPGSIRIENNFKIIKDEKYFLHNYWSNKGILKTPLAKAKNQEIEDLFYNFEYAQEFAFQFVPPVEVDEDMEDDEIEQIKMEVQHQMKEAKKGMLEWIEDNRDKSKPKLIKCVVIDKEMNFYMHKPLTDSYDFVIRVQPFLQKVKKELLKIQPQMIVFNFEEVDPKEREANEDIAYMYNDAKNLQYLIKVIKSMDDFDPFLIVFNSEHDTKKLQKTLNYPQIIAHKENINTDLVAKMAGLLEKKLYGDEAAFGENVVILDKNHQATYVEIEIPITIIACSENDFYFNTEEDFEIGTILRLNHPVNMYITIAETPKFSKEQAKYYAVVNGIGEDELQDYRKFINSVFFRDKMQKREEEAAEFEKKKEEFVKKQEEEKQKKIAEEKRKKEEEARAKKEAEEAAKAQAESEAAAAELLGDEED
jgi:CheY-like chemotaxis protein